MTEEAPSQGPEPEAPAGPAADPTEKAPAPRRKRPFLLVLAGLGALAGFYFLAQTRMDRPEDHGRFGILPGAYDPKESEGTGSYNLSYFVQMSHPATEAVKFYGRALRRRGWRPDPSWRGMGPQETWTSWSAESSLKRLGLTCAYQLNKAWVSQDGKRTFLLILNYYDTLQGKGCDPAPRSQELLVTLQEVPRS